MGAGPGVPLVGGRQHQGATPGASQPGLSPSPVPVSEPLPAGLFHCQHPFGPDGLLITDGTRYGGAAPGPPLGLTLTLSGLGGWLSEALEALLAEGGLWSLGPVPTPSVPIPSRPHQESPGDPALWSWAPRMPCL